MYLRGEKLMLVKRTWRIDLVSMGVCLAASMPMASAIASPLYPLSDRWVRDTTATNDEIGDQQQPEGNPQLIMGDTTLGEARAGFLFSLAGENVAGATQITLSLTVGDIAFLNGATPDFRLVHVPEANYSGSVPGGSAALNATNDAILKGTYEALGDTVVGSLSGHDPDNDGVILGADVTGPDASNSADTTPGDTLVWDVTSYVQADALSSLGLSLFRVEVADPSAFNGTTTFNIQWWSGNGGANATAEGAGLGTEVLPQLTFVPEPASVSLMLAGGLLMVGRRKGS